MSFESQPYSGTLFPKSMGYLVTMCIARLRKLPHIVNGLTHAARQSACQCMVATITSTKQTALFPWNNILG